MANKTINELTQITSFLKNDQLAVYDVSENVTVKGQLKNILKTPVEGLNTTAKNLIDAINELKQQIATLPPPITPYPTILKANDVTFYDYDGTIVHSYTKEEFLALDNMPENPIHEGLVAQGWNYSLEDAKDYVSKYEKLNVGQMYTTASGATEIDIELTKGRTTPLLGICPNGTVTVDWGDNSTDTISGTSLTTLVNTQHAYASAGKYTIKLTGTFGIIGESPYGSRLLWDQKTFFTRANNAYQNAVKAIRIGNGVTSIGDYAFQYCYSLNSVTISNNIISIGNYAFNSCYLLNSVTIPGSVTSIKDYAFCNCPSLSSVTISGSVTSFGGSIFLGCRSLSSIMIPSRVTFIGINVFQSCSFLSSVIIPKGITSIRDNAFKDCSSLSSITIPESVTSIEKGAFYNCYSLSSVTIPGSVTSIKDGAFQNCYSLSLVTILEGVTSIGNSAFRDCYSLSSVTVPDSVTFMGSNVFQDSHALSSVTISEGVTSIGSNVFNGCYSLNSVTIPEGVTSIGGSAFEYCSSLSSVTIPEGVTSIGNNAFIRCPSVAEYHLKPMTPPTIQTSTFSGIPSDCVIYVPTGSLSAYQSAQYWSNYASQMVEE